MLSYADFKKRPKQIVAVTQGRIMPPWAALRGYRDFEHDRSLTTDERGKIAQWISEGAPEGGSTRLPPLPAFTSGWKLGKPDLVVRVAQPYTMPAESQDVLRKFVIRVPLEEAKYVKAWEFNPGNTKVVHHAFLSLDQSGWARYFDAIDPLPGFDGSTGGETRPPDGFNLAWNPGRAATPPDDNLSWRLEPGTDLVVELHLCATGKTEQVEPSVALYFASKPPTIHPGVVGLWADTIDLPPGEKAYVVRDEFTLPVDVSLVSLGPHAHYRGKDFQAWAVLPDGSKQWLLRIKDWDFNWQNTYTFADPLALPKGTVLRMKITYDNSSENRRNPANPPKYIRIGRNSSDEMGEILCNLRLKSEEDANILRQSYGQVFFEKSFRRDLFLAGSEPNNAEAHYNLGVNFQMTGDLPRSAEHYEASLRINPNHPWAHNNLGSVYRELNRDSDAMTQFNAAIRLNPQDARAHNNLGHLYLLHGDLDRASMQFEQALAIKNDFVEAETNLGTIAVRKKDRAAATAHFERALRLNPNYEWAREQLNSLQSLPRNE